MIAAMQMQGAAKLIGQRGGYRMVAGALGWPPTTVHTYCRTDSAPNYRWAAIKALPKLKAAVRAGNNFKKREG